MPVKVNQALVVVRVDRWHKKHTSRLRPTGRLLNSLTLPFFIRSFYFKILLFPTIVNRFLYVNIPFAVHYEEIRSLLRETATNSAKIHSLARKYEHLRLNQIQLRFLHFNQHSITLLGIHMRHWAYKREKYTFIKSNIKVINTILKVNRDK